MRSEEEILYNLDDFDDPLEGLQMRSYTADFETTTDPSDCRVWAYAICQIGATENLVFGNSIDDFIRWCSIAANCQLYFHNLAFDGAFIIDWLERNGWTWAEDAKHAGERSYTTLIGDMNQFYSITLYFAPKRKCVIYDSLKIIPLSIAQMARAFGLEEGKGELDYEAYREVGHVLTDEEKDYIRRDVQIAAHAMDVFLRQGLTKMTAGSNALYDYKKMLGGNRHFRRIYPELDEDTDAFIRKAYRGGFTYVAPRFQGKRLGEGIVLDVNSLYPSVMAACDGQELPYGEPVWFDGAYEADRRYPLWVALVTCKFRVKPDHIPCVQLKGNGRFKATEYIEDSKIPVTFAITSVDWKLIEQQYDLSGVEFFGGYKFKANPYQFKEYVEKWVGVKNQATLDGNLGMRQTAKLMLTSLYGKFASRITAISRKPELVDDVVRYVDLPEEKRHPVYLPVGVFVTAYARYKTITSAQALYDRFVYADTDSLHLIGTDEPEGLDIDPVKLGAWKHESTFDEAKFLRAKCYAEHEVGADHLTVHVSGMPKACHPHVTLDNFEFGAEYPGKLYTKRVKGGIVLEEGPMKLREGL